MPTLAQRLREQGLTSGDKQIEEVSVNFCEETKCNRQDAKTEYRKLREALLSAYTNVKCRPIDAQISEHVNAQKNECVDEVMFNAISAM